MHQLLNAYPAVASLGIIVTAGAAVVFGVDLLYRATLWVIGIGLIIRDIVRG